MISENTTNVVTVTGTSEEAGECPPVTDSATVTVLDEAQACTSALSAVLLRYTGPTIERPVTVQVRAGDFRNDETVFQFPDGLAFDTVLTLPEENDFSVDAAAHGEAALGATTIVSINGVPQTLDTSCSTPLLPASAAALESPTAEASDRWEIVEFGQR
jgi:hypothetical protein